MRIVEKDYFTCNPIKLRVFHRIVLLCPLAIEGRLGVASTQSSLREYALRVQYFSRYLPFETLTLTSAPSPPKYLSIPIRSKYWNPAILC
ncbi:hypothetical protein KFK09_028552 [Dendrobium nobile]|uniref:Uncharacterized protein n=1 Tax=Dendrobium nobile TaxID=94219 RepID=A0A8T3A7W9_DENNO|nr:hypothetical protein KFK09_028552 [Dendrobium nobile]